MNKRAPLKSVLRKDIADRILADERVLGEIAHDLMSQSNTIRQAVKRQAESMCLPYRLTAIRKALGLPSEEDIVDLIENESHLHE